MSLQPAVRGKDIFFKIKILISLLLKNLNNKVILRIAALGIANVSGSGFLFCVSNNYSFAELADIFHFHNCNKHNSRLAVD